MIRHIVMWKLAPEGAQEHAAEIKRRLEGLVGQIEGLRSLEVGRNLSQGGYDLCLMSIHDNLDALHIYRDHPLHKEIQSYVHECITERVFCDSEIVGRRQGDRG